MARKNNPFNLTDQQLLFAMAYQKGGCKNAYAAALEAGYSKNYAKAGSGKLLEIVDPYVQTLTAKTLGKYEKERDNNLSALIAQRDLDPLEIFGEKVTSINPKTGNEETHYVSERLKRLDTIPLEVRRCIQSIEKTRYGVRVKLTDRQKAIETINRMLGLNEPDEIKHSGIVIAGYNFEDPD